MIIMSNEEQQMKRLEAFACENKDRSISTVVIKDGVACVTDGVFCMKERLDGEFSDIVTREDGRVIPVDRMMMLASLPDSAKKWYVLEADKKIEDDFCEQYRAERAENRASYNNRYKHLVCPSCGDEVWWDSWNEKIVDETEPFCDVRIQSVMKPVSVRFGDEKELPVNFAYLFLVMKLYGDIEVSFGEEDGMDIMFFRTKDGRMSAVLKPLRERSTEFTQLCAKEVADADH